MRCIGCNHPDNVCFWERKPNMTHDEYERAFEGTYTCPFMSESENKNLEGSEVNWR